MPADLEAVDALAQVIGVMNGPAREPEHLFLELAQDRELGRCNFLIGLVHRRGFIASAVSVGKSDAEIAGRHALPTFVGARHMPRPAAQPVGHRYRATHASPLRPPMSINSTAPATPACRRRAGRPCAEAASPSAVWVTAWDAG